MDDGYFGFVRYAGAAKMKVLPQGNRVVHVPPHVALKSLVATAVFDYLEWSGYAPYTEAGDEFLLLDLYILADENSGGHTVLGPEAAVTAWTRTEQDHPGVDVAGLAWVHRHNGTNPSWSTIDDKAVEDLVKGVGQQLSVEFAGHRAIARWDTADVGEGAKVIIDWGPWQDHLADMITLRAANTYRAPAVVVPPKNGKGKKKGFTLPWLRQRQEVKMCHLCNEVATNVTCELCGEVTCWKCRKRLEDMDLCLDCARMLDVESPSDIMECTACGATLPADKLTAIGGNHLWCERCVKDFGGLRGYFEGVDDGQAKE